MHDPILTVSELNHLTKDILEETLGGVTITGEISNWVRASSGHCYFSLKDENAQIRCAFFRGQAARTNFQPENGLAVLAKGKVSLYPARGDYQLIVSSLEPAGKGQLALLFNQLKAKLDKAGLFAEEHKKPLPALPQQIGVITSPTGAALQDILKVLERRFPLTPIRVYPAQVQGAGAPEALCRALDRAIADNQCDVLILARGGGSMEDLWGFNDETLARQLFSCPIPVITGIGHEIDFTVADLVADVRAATPSAAAEQVVPDQAHLLATLAKQKQHLFHRLRVLLQQTQSRINEARAKLKHPRDLVLQNMQRLDFLDQRLLTAISQLIRDKQTEVRHLAATLDQLSPLSTLARGYSILLDNKKKVVRSITQVTPNQQLTTHVSDGCISMQVIDTLTQEEPDR